MKTKQEQETVEELIAYFDKKYPNNPVIINDYVRKIGSNRGSARVWLEGKILSDNGWKAGDLFDVLWSDGAMVYVKRRYHGERKVAGTDARPIIDTNSKRILETLGASIGDKVRVSCESHHIVIDKVREESK